MQPHLLATAVWAAFLLRPAQAGTLSLSPNMPALASPGVPALRESLPDADRIAPDLRIVPGQPFTWVASPGQGFRFRAEAGSLGDRAVLTVWDWNNRPVAQQILEADEAQDFAAEVVGRGTYLLTLDAFAGSDCKARLARSFSVCPSNEPRREAWRTGEFQVGACSFPGRQHWRNEFGPGNPPGLSEPASREMDADLSARLGMTLVRPDLPGFWPGREQPMDFALTDAALGCFTSRGFRLVLQLGFPHETEWTLMPQYAGVTDPKWRYPRQESVVRPYAEAVARRYGPQAEYIELYNEPDNEDFWRGTVSEFTDTHRWMAESVRTACPEATILSGGLCLMDPERTGQIAAGIREHVDAVGYHSHGGVEALQATLTAMRALHAAAGYERPAFVNTEMGFANWRLDMERHSAATAVQKLLYCWAHGNRAALLYCSRDIGGPRSSGDWGYIDYFMCPRFTYGAVAAVVDHLAGAAFVRALRELNGLFVYEFHRGDQRLIALFTAGGDARPVALGTDAARASILDAMGNASDVAPTAGKLHLTAGLYPALVVLDGAHRVSVEPN